MTPLPAATRDTRRRWLAAALALPTILAALALSTLEGARLLRPDNSQARDSFVYSFGEAIAEEDLDRALQFIRAGQDPNGLIGVRHAVLTDNRSVLVSPLLWAVATARPHSVRLLLGYGARMDHPANRGAVCLADALGNVEIARLLARFSPQPPAAAGLCPEAGSRADLLSVFSQTGP